MNKVILMGNVGGDPQIRYVEGRPVAEFSLATSEPPRRRSDGTATAARTERHRSARRLTAGLVESLQMFR